MSHWTDELRDRINDLAIRVERLERRSDAAVSDPHKPPHPPHPETSAPEQPQPPPQHPDRQAASERITRQPSTRKTKPRPKAEPRALNLEYFVGAKLFAIIGALVIVAGAALILKLAIDEGWFNLLSNRGKCLNAAIFGVALLFAGEIARRKISPFASIGCSAAGIGVLYASAYAVYGFYGLVSHQVGFMLLTGVAALGILVGARARLASVSALSLVAAYAVPLFFLDADPRPIVIPGYTASILVIGLVLSALLGGRFAALRSLAWWGTVLWGTAWATLLHGTDHPAIALVFLAFAWSAIHTELLYSATKRGITGDNASAPTLQSWRQVRPIASSFSTTAWATLLACLALDDATGESWLVPATLALVTLALAALSGGPLRVLRTPPTDDRQRLACVLAIESGALLIAAIALGFAGWMESVAWVALGIAALVGGRSLRARPLDIYGLVALFLVTSRLALIDVWFKASAPDDLFAMGMHLTRWSLLMAIDGAAWALAGALLRRSVREAPNANHATAWRAIGNACIATGITILVASALHEQTTRLATIWLLLAMAWSTLTAGSLLRSKGIRLYSIVAPGPIVSIVLLGMWFENKTGRALFSSAHATEFVLTTLTPPMLAASLYWIVAAFITASGAAPGSRRTLAHWCTGAGLAILYASVAHPDSASWAVAWAWLALSIPVFLTQDILPAIRPRRWAIIGAAAAILPWSSAYVDTRWNAMQSAPLTHPGLWMAMAIAAAILVMASIIRRREPPPSIGHILGLLGVGVATMLIFSATTLEVGRITQHSSVDETSRRAAISIWWGVFAIGLLAAGFRRKVPIVRHTGLALLAIATSKAAIFDLADVPPAWRAASFLALGLMMLAVGLVYAKVSASIASEPER